AAGGAAVGGIGIDGVELRGQRGAGAGHDREDNVVEVLVGADDLVLDLELNAAVGEVGPLHVPLLIVVIGFVEAEEDGRIVRIVREVAGGLGERGVGVGAADDGRRIP